MSENNLDANHLTASEDAFDKFQAESLYEEEDFITLSDIATAPQQNIVPDLSDELNEIPYDNEVVLDTIHNDDQAQVNNHNGTGLQLLDISENNVFENPPVTSDNESNNIGNLDQQQISRSCDGLGDQNYVVEDSTSMIQDSFLSTTLDQNIDVLETSAQDLETVFPRRTKRGRIPNTAKYPMTAASNSEAETVTPAKRRPGRPKKNPPVQTLSEPDSTNTDSSLLHGTESTSEPVCSTRGNRTNALTPVQQQGKRGRRGRGRKPKANLPPLANKQLNSFENSENTIVDSTKTEDDCQMELDSTLPSDNEKKVTPNTSRRKKTKGKKTNKTISIKIAIESCDDDGDDVCLSKLKKDLEHSEFASVSVCEQNEITSAPASEQTKITSALASEQSEITSTPASESILAPNPVENKPILDDSMGSMPIDDIESNLALIVGEPQIVNNSISKVTGTSSTRRNSKMPSLPDFEYNIDKVVKDASIDNKTDETLDSECLLVEDTSKRRRVAKKSFVYDEFSEEEDPFADVASSDEEPKRRKKGTKYYSDDEYVPRSDSKKRGGGKIKSSSSESDDIDDEFGKKKKTPLGTSPLKRGRKAKNSLITAGSASVSTAAPKSLDTSLVSVIKPKGDDADIEGCLESTVIKIDETLRPPAEAWAKSNEFQNFIASNKNSGLQIKKVSTKESIETVVPLEIPVIDQTKSKKNIEISTQTHKPSTSTMGVQTSAPYDIPMKMNVDLTPGQAEKACEFLSSVVRTTVELGQLMSQKSQDFMKKKINPANVTDTLKMDYCVRKSFLLFKLAKHNLLQMEEDLSNQYEAFLDEHKLSLCREVPKKIVPKPKDDSDSDCEIIEVVGTNGSKPEKATPKVNPKTVFLNKELSIKIAKKPSTPEKSVPGKKKLEIKGRHAVWINKNVMVKKVTPTQSFLAQDSRNKKPPDVITKKMVSDFFESYNRKKALLTCAPFISNDWSCIQRQYVCHYFVNELDTANTVIASDNNIEIPEENGAINETNFYEHPKTLFSLCARAILKCLYNKNMEIEKYTCNNVTDGDDTKGAVTLFRLCLDVLRSNLHNKHSSDNVHKANDKEKTTEENYTCDENNTDSTEEYNYLFEDNDNDIDDNKNENCEQELEDRPTYKAISPLTKICYKEIVKIFFTSEIHQKHQNNMTLTQNDVSFDNANSMDSYSNIDDGMHLDDIYPGEEALYLSDNDIMPNNPKSLFKQCVELIQNLQRIPKKHHYHAITSYADVSNIKSLKTLAFEIIKHNLYPSNIEKITDSAFDIITNDENANETFTINCINTLSEEAFDSLQEPVRIRKQSQDSSNFSDGFDNNDYVDHDEIDYDAVNEADDNGWASQLQVQEFRSCFTPHVNTTDNMEETHETLHEPAEVTPHIKREPIDDYAEENIVDTSIVKSEPIQPMAVPEPDQGLHALNEMTHIPDEIITKRELIDPTIRSDGSPMIHSNSSYNVKSFEQFVNKNKMIQSMDESMNDPYDDHEIFSQSGLRIRRQHKPDLDPGHDPNMSLLVPHTFEPLHLVEAKGSLMESSSDDGTSSKKAGKKKDKRKKKNKKEVKTTNKEAAPVVPKEVPAVNDKIIPENEVAVLTRRMREKIRQEEKKIQSSDSDSDSYYSLASRKDKSKKDKVEKESDTDSDTLYMFNKKDEDVKDKTKKDEEIKDKTKTMKNKQSSADITKSKKKQDLVQCNNVDSTETLSGTEVTDKEKFSGFSVIDQNETTNYQKLLQFVYKRILPDVEDDYGKNKEHNAAEEATADAISEAVTGPFIDPNEPVELLECEPTIPMFDDEPRKRPGPKKHKNKKNIEMGQDKNTPKDFLERHGWHCYNVNPNDPKLYANAQIILEKLPESFVEIYKEYQDVMDKDLDDHEVDRLINLQSLNRSGKDFKDIKDGKTKSKSKTNKEGSSELNSGNISRASSPTYSDHFDELLPSDDDEGANPDDETPPPVAVRSSENNLAKNLLMNDHESDSDGGGKKIKEEPKDPDAPKTKRSGPKSKTKVNNQDSESLMLTADKMMNKELNLLHAPIVLQDNIKTEVKDTSPKEEAKHSKRSSKRQTKDRVKNDDDSSSEEEKQWVSTKEKLLKRMGKKEDVVADDAKRAKLVNEFIERRNEAERKDKRENNQGRSRRNRKKRLERQKQLRFLSNELYNEGVDGVVTGKRGAAAGLFKGRRNIRKVIDKKSLARSTVVANMEEFERKRRLNMRQNRLRELLGCEEGVNVLVINDEVCLEYDFEEQRPVVSVHPFFTKVMKAHQYEGVKFMWDACFESLHNISMGQPGGGCILAHCMGLGKTLQVLALLHTVLTHPRANMQRVLVCCPLSTVLNWVDEIHKWIGPVTDEIKVFELSKLRKTYERAYQLEDWYNGGGIFIIGYELFRSLTTLDPEIDEIRPTIINKIRTALIDPGPDIVICDEGHLLKNDCSVLAVAMSRVVTKRRIVLTGTPMQNNLREYFCMVNFIKPNLLGTYSEYSNRFENPIMNGQHRDSREEDIKLMKARTHILHKVLEGCLQRQEASVLYPYLPKKHEYTVFIPLTKCQWQLYNHYIDFYAKKHKQKQILKDFHILQKIWSHPQVLHNFHLKARDKRDKIKAEKLEDDLAIADQEADIKPAETELWWLEYFSEGDMLESLDSSNKFVAVFRILHECVALGDKVLIFSTSLFCLDALEYFLKKIKKWSLGQEYYRLDGSVPAEVRQKWVREFNAENNLKTKLFLISTRAGCLGLNMTAANRVIILDTSWNPAHDIQSIFRVYRFGQKKDCYIYRLVALGTMEQKIYERSVTKQAVACRVVDEQQIDRHYNLAELTELYSVDEMGMSVAGGVAVGVSDVALLRVARDAAVHAVHEHDSLLRGEHEQGLPEHERAAAWSQFQLEHENKQKQNELHVKQAARVAMKRLEMDHLRQQKLQGAAQSHPPPLVQIKPKTELGYNLIEPKEEPGVKPRWGRKYRKVVQCRIPIVSGPQPGPSNPEESEKHQMQMVQKITSLLIKHKFVKEKTEHAEVSNLISKVRRMVETGQPMALGPGYDELSSSIANVLLHQDAPMPPPTNIEAPPPPPPPPPPTVPEVKPKRGRKKKQILPEKPPTPTPEAVPEPEPETDGRRRRKAAIAAEKQFDSQQDVIDIDDDADEWQADLEDEAVAVDDWLTDCEADDETVQVEKTPKETPPQEITRKIVTKRKSIAKKKEPVDDVLSSILLSDDEVEMEVSAPAPTPRQSSANQDDEVIELLPSLLTNAHFIKIVACAYAKNNPMMDKAAARLAAQYSTLKTLRESESEGKPITSGPVYDIAVQALGKDVLRKLQKTNSKSDKESTDTSNKLRLLLGGNPEPAPPPVAKKPRIGPKSKVMKEVKQERIDTPTKTVDTPTKAVDTPAKAVDTLTQLVDRNPVIKAVSNATLFAPSKCKTKITTAAAREESILPDDEVVISLPTETHVDRKPIILRKIKLGAPSVPSATPVAMGRGPAPPATTDLPQQAQTSGATICLDSDDEDRPPAVPPVLLRRRLTKIGTGPAPVPIALTGPNAQPITLTAPQAQNKTTYYQLSPCGTRAIPVHVPAPIALPMSSSSGPIPISLVGPASQPTPSQTMPLRGRPMPGYFTDSSTQPGRAAPPVPISLSGPGSQPVQFSLVGPDSQPVNLQPAPVPMSLVDANGRPVGLAGMPMFPSGQVFSSHQPPPPAQAPSAARAPQQQPATVKPGDLLRITQSGLVEILERKREALNQMTTDLTTTIIDDEEPAPVAAKALPKLAPKPMPQVAPKPMPQVAPKPTPQVAPKPTPRPPPKATPKPPEPPKVPTPPPEPVEKPAKRKSRRIWSSSSSSSGRSRSSSPKDPLAILKDVVHIQAPDKPAQPEKKKVDATPKSTNVGSYKVKHGNQKTESPRSDPKTDKNTVDLTNVFVGPGYSRISSNKKPIDTSKPSTSRSNDVRKDYKTDPFNLDKSKFSKKPSTSTNSANSSKSSSSKLSLSMPSSSKYSLNKPSSAKPSSSKSTPFKLVGTSKSIILDGKSKSLKVEPKSSSLPMTSVKKQADKRPAPSTSVGAPQKKSKVMTLKDFDIDDIDDIIELD